TTWPLGIRPEETGAARAGRAARATARTARNLRSTKRLTRRDGARQRVGRCRFHAYPDQLAGRRGTRKDDRLHLAALSRHPPVGPPGRSLDQHLDLGPDETTVDLARDRLL